MRRPIFSVFLRMIPAMRLPSSVEDRSVVLDEGRAVKAVNRPRRGARRSCETE